MKTAFSLVLILLLLTLSLSLALYGCTKAGSALNGSGKIIDQDVKIDGFDSLNVKGAFVLDLIQGDSFKVTLSTDDNLFNRIRVVVERKTLKLSIEAPASFFPTSLKATITMPSLIAVNLSGGAKTSISGFQSANNFSLFLEDTSSINGSIIADNIDIHLSDSSVAILQGEAEGLVLMSSGNSKLDLGKFTFNRAQIKLQNGAEAILDVIGAFNVTLNDTSRLYYSGNPIFTNTSISGQSTMTMIQENNK